MLPKGCSFHLIQNSSCVWCIKLDLLSIYNLVSNFTNRVAKSLAPWGANMQPMSHYKGARLPYLIWLVCCDSLDIRFKPLCQTLALVSAKDTDVSQPGKKCGLDFWLLSVKQTVTLCSLQRFFFFFPKSPAIFLHICPSSLTHCSLVKSYFGSLESGSSSATFCLYLTQGNISVTTCFTLPLQLFSFQLLRSVGPPAALLLRSSFK